MDAVPGLKVIESCLTCHLRAGRLFCDLPPDALAALENIRETRVVTAHSTIFSEGQKPRGVYVLCSGKAKLSTNSKDGKTIILKIAEAGEVLGLSATVSGIEYEISAETIEPARLNFISSANFMAFLNEHGEACLRVAKLLSNSYQSAYEEIRSLGLSNSISQRLAKLLLERAETENSGSGSNQLRFHLPFSHEEISQMIGTSRETVTRLLTGFKNKQLIKISGATVLIPDRKALAEIVNS
jgi:CRP/FNR family transcriptional regulator, cyclic AMP receptor protein